MLIITIYIINLMVNNKIMKKILFIISLCVILLTSCQTQMQNVVEVSEKTIKLTEEITINYPSINDFVDNEFLTSVESTYNYVINNYDTRSIKKRWRIFFLFISRIII